MNKEIKDYIDEKVEQFKSELIKSIEEKENQPKKIWNIEKGDKYYTIVNGHIQLYRFDNFSSDIAARNIGNMFLTQEEAEFELKRRKIEAIMKKYSSPFEYEKNNWVIYYSHIYKTIGVAYWGNNDYGVYYFKTKEIAQQVIDEVGEERLKKYWFKVVD